MSDQGAGIEAAKAIADPLGTLAGLLAGFVPEGPLRTVVLIVEGLCLYGAYVGYNYYIGLLAKGGTEPGSIERQDYDRLRANLDGGNLAARLYAKWLTVLLNRIERFFGDVGLANRTPFLPSFLRLRDPAPLWTAPTYDRCLLLALIYPILAIFLIWAVSGHVGPAEAALGLKPDVPAMKRGIAIAAISFSSFAVWRTVCTTNNWTSLAWWIGAFAASVVSATVGALAVAVAVLGATVAVLAVAQLIPPFTLLGLLGIAISVGTLDSFGSALLMVSDPYNYVASDNTYGVYFDILRIAITIVIFTTYVRVLWSEFSEVIDSAFASRLAIARDLPGVVAIGLVVIFSWLVAVASAPPFVILLIVIGLIVGVVAISQLIKETKSSRQGVFFAVFSPAMFLLCLFTAYLASLQSTWTFVGPLLLFLILLTLINAPFDWASLGLTRALLRRGLELGGWWPYLLAVVDAALAGLVIVLLALAMVIGVQAFDELAVHGGGKAVLPLDTLFDGIAQNPAAPEYWWAYALLLSTMIPSLVNLAIGGMALTRGIPWLARLLLQWMPEGRDVPEYKRQLAAIGLTTQMFAGAGLGLAAQWVLAWGLIFHVMPTLGLDLLAMARAVAAFDVPARAGWLFTGIL
jgi:hypothetical protein